MKTKHFLVLVSLFILLPTVALAQGGWITLPGHAFIARSSVHQWYCNITPGSESYLYARGTGSHTFVAPVVFPPEAEGTNVRQINATVRDFDDSVYISVGLYRMNRYSGITQRVYDVATGTVDTPGKTVITDTSGGYRLIDNDKYAWFVRVFFSTVPTNMLDLRLYSVRIQYQ